MNNSRILSIVAYYLSEFDMEAVAALGYRTRTESFKELSKIFKRENNYLKIKRDEFDALPESSSTRNGWKNREPVKEVVELATYLKNFDFDEMTQMVKSLVENAQSTDSNLDLLTDTIIDECSETDIESIINAKDPSATIRYINNTTNVIRVYNHSIITNLKALYKGKCQICGDYPLVGTCADICEAHHIEYFSKSMNNDASNILIVCPNHHRFIHKLNPVFDKEGNKYIFSDGMEIKIKLNHHLNEL